MLALFLVSYLGYRIGVPNWYWVIMAILWIIKFIDLGIRINKAVNK